MVMVSILVPVYNVEPYLRQCLDSLINQTYHNLEIILADDGSTDRSGMICDEYARKDSRISVIHKHNEGLLWTRRILFGQAEGDYVLCVDSDDWIEHDAVETAVEYALQHKADVVLFGHDRVTDGGEFERKIKPYTEDHKVFSGDTMKELRKQLVLTGRLNSIWDKLISKKLLSREDDHTPVYKKIAMGEDKVQLFPIFQRAERAVYCDRVLYHYRYSDSAMSQNFKASYLKDKILMTEEAGKFMNLYGFDTAENRNRLYEDASYNIIKNCYTLIHCGKYSFDEITGWLQYVTHFLNSVEQEICLKKEKWNFLDKIVCMLLKKQRYRTLFFLLRGEYRYMNLLRKKTKK